MITGIQNTTLSFTGKSLQKPPKKLSQYNKYMDTLEDPFEKFATNISKKPLNIKENLKLIGSAIKTCIKANWEYFKK